MTNRDPDTVVRKFIDGDLNDDDVQDALHIIADDPDARELLQFELRTTQQLAASPATRPSPAFASRTMTQVDRTKEPSAAWTRLETWIQKLVTPPIVIPVRPLGALATLVVLVGLTVFLWPGGPADSSRVMPQSSQTATVQPATVSTSQADNTVWTRFVYVDNEAQSVAVAGDFSQWEPIELSPRQVDDKTVWTGLVRVRRGEHEYQYVIDGKKWVTDPLAPVKRKDGFGAKNAVLQL